MNEKSYIVKMSDDWKSIDKLYDKLIPICRKEARSEHRALGISSTIKKVNKEITIMKCKARHDTREYKRFRNRRLNNDKVELILLDDME